MKKIASLMITLFRLMTFASVCRSQYQYLYHIEVAQNPQWTRDLIDIWMTRNDTQNFIVLGDPAAKVKMQCLPVE